MLRADEDGWMWMFSLHNEFLLYIFSNANGIEKSDRENFFFVQCSNEKHLLQCKAKYNDETIEI